MKRLLITGASSGIGRATALRAAAQGYRVAVHYNRQQDAADEVVHQIRAAGGQAFSVQADLSHEAEVVRLYEQLDAELGGLDAVINSAGISWRSSVRELQAARVAQLFALNVSAVIISCREALKRLQRGGVILNVSSMAATIGGRPGSAAYAASKAAVDVFTIGLAKEVASEGIRAISVRPGMVDTEMTRDVLSDPRALATVKASIPLGRAAHVQEVAQPLLWLLSEQASFITGCTLDISGGGFHIAR